MAVGFGKVAASVLSAYALCLTFFFVVPMNTELTRLAKIVDRKPMVGVIGLD